MNDRTGRRAGRDRPAEIDVEPLRLEAAIRRGVQVLNAFRRTDAGLGNAELAGRTGLTKPTVSRITYTLARQGYLSFEARTRTYRLGPRAAALGSAALASLDVRRHAVPRMREMIEGAAFNVCLGMRDRYWMVYSDVCEGDALIGLRAWPGSRAPLLTSAIGRAYLAGLSPDARAEVLQMLLKAPRAPSEADVKGMELAVQDFAARGFCISAGDWEPGINGVAAPVRTPDGRVFAINLGGPAYKLPIQELSTELGPRLARLAQGLEAVLSETLSQADERQGAR